jgi:hypothetical protein
VSRPALSAIAVHATMSRQAAERSDSCEGDNFLSRVARPVQRLARLPHYPVVTTA